MLALRILDVKYQLVENARRGQVQANNRALGLGGAQVHGVKSRAQAAVVVVEERGYELACETMLQPVTCLQIFQLLPYGQQHPCEWQVRAVEESACGVTCKGSYEDAYKDTYKDAYKATYAHQSCTETKYRGQ